MKAIDKAWEENLKLNEDDRYETKKELINALCVDGDYDFKIKAQTDDEGAIICKQFGKEGGNRCEKCFNCEIIEDDSTKDNDINDNQSTFDKLKDCLVDELSLNELNEKEFKDLLTNDSSLIYVKGCDNFTYDNLPIIATYLLEVYDYAKELKNKVEYVDFETAKKWMYDNNGVVECEGVLYDNSSMFSLEVTDSDKWILIKSE